MHAGTTVVTPSHPEIQAFISPSPTSPPTGSVLPPPGVGSGSGSESKQVPSSTLAFGL